jgi:hypothetical protein
MKKLIEQVDGEGLEALMGEQITLFCLNYFYTGKLVGVNEKDILLESPSIVYETGSWDKKDYANAQKLPCEKLYVRTGAIEAYGVLK